jgi:cell division protein FtsZ
LAQFVDTLIIIPNQNLFRIANEKTTFADAFKMADDVLYSGVRGVTDLMIMPGLINLDFADIKTVMSEMGKAMMGTGEATGDRRAVEATERAISNPLLEDASMKGARGVLINITGGLDMTLFEVDEAANRIREEVDTDANIIFGSTFDPSMEGIMRVSVVATGIDAEAHIQKKMEKRAMNMFNERTKLAEYVTSSTHTESASVQANERAALGTLRNEPSVDTDAVNENANATHTGFIPPKAVNPHDMDEQNSFENHHVNHDRAEQIQEKKKAPSLFERLTGMRSRATASATAEPVQTTHVQPVPEAQVTTQQLAQPKPSSDDDLLDIPAFLRRKK